MQQLDRNINVITPLGPALAVGIGTGDQETTIWFVFIKATGESWIFRNHYIRLAPCITEGRGKVSPFLDVPPGLEVHIKRYQDNGWLPKG